MHCRFTNTRALTTLLVVLACAAPAAASPFLSAASAATGASASTSTVIKGPDVSHYNHPDKRTVNWPKVAATGVSFAISKATEGTAYTDPFFATDYAGSAAAGLVHGSYHFARPGFPIGKTARQQAKYFAGVIGPVTTAKTLPPALDLEVTGGLAPSQLVTWAEDFLLEMRTLTGRTPMLYTYPSFWENDLDDPTALARFPLWMAHFNTSIPPVANLWQFTDHAHIKGFPRVKVSGSSKTKAISVDESVFQSSKAFPWSVISNGTLATSWPAQTPAAPLAIQATASGDQVRVGWIPPDAGTSPITGYTVTASPGGKSASIGPNTFHASIVGLSAATKYTFTVTATNAVGIGAASVATAPIAPRVPTSLVVTSSPSITFGSKLPVKAVLKRTDTKAALAGQSVLVYRRASTSGPWRQIRTLSTDATGTSSLVLAPSRSAQLELVFPGGHGIARASSYQSYVVRPTVTAALSATTVVHDGTLTIRGSSTPAVAGEQVLRERLVNGTWVVRSTTHLGPRGGFVFHLHPKAKGIATYRIVLPAVHGRTAAHTHPFSFTVT
jgi:GH25 family lysozyme M1 (1,4-beta-N-acetylmuramidase)